MYPSPFNSCVISIAFFTCAAAKANTSALQTRARPAHETRIGKQIRRAPEQFDAGAFLLLFEDRHDRVEIAVGLGQIVPFRRDVAVVEGEIGRAQLLDELNRHPRALLRVGDGIGAVVPRAQHRAHAERIPAGAAERVPIDHRKAQVIAHRLALDHFVRVVMLESQRILRFRAFVADVFNFIECFGVRFHL